MYYSPSIIFYCSSKCANTHLLTQSTILIFSTASVPRSKFFHRFIFYLAFLYEGWLLYLPFYLLSRRFCLFRGLAPIFMATFNIRWTGTLFASSPFNLMLASSISWASTLSGSFTEPELPTVWIFLRVPSSIPQDTLTFCDPSSLSNVSIYNNYISSIQSRHLSRLESLQCSIDFVIVTQVALVFHDI